ncbi:MAG: DNA recombination protein RmuC [Deltaproteobacteria bacterium]|nr:DNA recombination protein RmuC [Deltaproteobacteria bacterium]
MTIVIYIIIAFVAGAAMAWLVSRSHSASAEALANELRMQAGQKDSETASLRSALDTEKRARVEAVTLLASAEERFKEQLSLIDEMKREMTDTFNALSGAALKSNNEQFFILANARLGVIVEETKKHIGVHTSDMNGMVKPLTEALRRYEEEVKKIEASRLTAYGSLTEQLKQVSLTQETLKKETGNLVTALRRPEVRGRWGEMQLRRVAELAGMSTHCDFSEQASVETDSGRQRPDMIVHLPMGRDIVVDAKVALDAYLSAVSATTEDERRAHIKRHAEQVKEHMRMLSSKEYSKQFAGSLEFVVMFIPGESFFSAAMDIEGTLVEDGMKQKVLIATPTTLIALLHSVAYGWRQETLAENAQKISELGRELHERMGVFAEHLDKLRDAIIQVNNKYNDAVGSFESRAFVSARKFAELGAGSGKVVPELKQVDVSPRRLAADAKAADSERGE